MRHAYGLMPGVLEEWHRQGLPLSVRTDEEVSQYFGFPARPHPLPIRIGPDPPIDARVIEETETYRIAIDGWGRRTKLMKAITTLPQVMEFPIREPADWEFYRDRLRPTPDRVGSNIADVAERNRREGHVNMFASVGFYWFPRDLVGDETLGIWYYEHPDLVHEMNDTWCTLIEQALTSVLERTPLDAIHLAEDMAYRNASMIGPHTFDEFLEPYYLRIKSIIDRYEVPVFSVDTDGCLNELIHWFSACGVNIIGPNEVQAGNDVVAYRRVFGRTMAFDGGLDKRELIYGRDRIDAMLENTIPFLKETGGGWVICLDHRVIPGTPLADFEYYLRRARELARM